jgi:GxxExxY protein
LGPVFWKSIYEACLCLELDRAGIPHGRQIPLPVLYDDVQPNYGYRADIVVAGEVIVEVNSVERLAPLYQAQLLTYLRLSGCRIGLLINFNTVSLTDGLRRCVL